MSSPADFEACRQILARGSKSFAAAALALPRAHRRDAAAVYAFLRIADDLVDDGDPVQALVVLRGRLDGVFSNAPGDDAVDRALADVVARRQLPRAPFDLLLEGFEWDATGHAYDSIEDVVAYSARVAATVGVIMTALLGRRDAQTLARACDLGIAMQLTNIARDVGEDARRGRVYLPARWLRLVGSSPDRVLSAAAPSPRVGIVVRRLLEAADRYYASADAGISRLPWRARAAIRGAALVYRDIGRVIRHNGYDSITRRAHTSGVRKAWLLLCALPATWRRRRTAPELPDASVQALVRASVLG